MIFRATVLGGAFSARGASPAAEAIMPAMPPGLSLAGGSKLLRSATPTGSGDLASAPERDATRSAGADAVAFIALLGSSPQPAMTSGAITHQAVPDLIGCKPFRPLPSMSPPYS